MNKLYVFLPLCLALFAVGCYDDAYADGEQSVTPAQVADGPTFPTGDPNYGCVIVQDQFGEREVCNTYYYLWAGGIVYYDNSFGVWVGPNGYWYGGVYRLGFWAGYHQRYAAFYHERGWYSVHAGWWSHGYHNGRVMVGYRAGHPRTFRHTVHTVRRVPSNHGATHFYRGGHSGGHFGGHGHH